MGTCSFRRSSYRSSYRSFHCPSAALSTSTAVCIPSSTCYPCSTSLCALALLLLALRPSYSCRTFATFTVHRSPFTVLVISDSPSLMYLLAISRFLLCRFYSQRSRVGFCSLLPLLGQLQLNMLYICLTMDHRISFSLPALPHFSSSTFAVYCRASAPRVASCLLFYWFLDSRPATSAAVVVYAFL